MNNKNNITAISLAITDAKKAMNVADREVSGTTFNAAVECAETNLALAESLIAAELTDSQMDRLELR